LTKIQEHWYIILTAIAPSCDKPAIQYLHLGFVVLKTHVHKNGQF